MHIDRIAVGLALGVAGVFSCANAASPNLDFGVVDEASYQNFLGAIEKSEHVRFAYVQNPKPRVVAAVAGLLEFATRNPLADEPQLTAFVDALDSKLQNYFLDAMMMPVDPDLERGAHLLTAARFSTPLTGVPALAGADTDVGPAILELLEIEIPAPNRFEEYQDRMELFELAQARDFEDAPEWQNLLMVGFSGRDLVGNPNAMLPAALEAYLLGQSLDPYPSPCAPSILGSEDTGFAKGVVVSGSHAYVADEEAGLVVVYVDSSGGTDLQGSVSLVGLAFGVSVDGNTAYVASGFGGGLFVIDVNDPGSPTVIGSVSLPGCFCVEAHGALVYAGNDADLLILDVSTPTNPVVVGSVTTPGLVSAVTVVGTTAYVADRDAGLQIIDVSNPAAPSILGSHFTPGVALGIAVSGTRAYLASDSGGLVIIDVSDPMNPDLIGGVDTPGSARGVVVRGLRAYVSDESSGLQIIDITDPASPSIVGAVDTPGSAFGLTVAGELAYVGDQQSGLQVIDIRSCNPDPVTEGLAVLPQDFATYETLVQQLEVAAAITNPMDPADPVALAARSQAIQNTTLMTTVFACQQSVANESLMRLGELTAVMTNEPDLEQGIMTESDPAMLAEIDASYVAKRDRVAPDRAALGGTVMIMRQAQDTTIQPGGQQLTTVPDLGNHTAKSNEKFFKNNRNLAAISEGVKIAGGIAKVLMSLKPLDPVTLVTGTVDLITGALGIGALFNASPTPEEMIFEQLQQMSMQIQEMQTLMNDRFDRVERQLNEVYLKISDGLDELSRDIGELKSEVLLNQEYLKGLRFDMLNVQSSLDRIEEALWGMGATLLLLDFAHDFDAALGFRADTLTDLPFVLSTPNFNTSAEELSFFGATTAASVPFAGPAGVGLTPANATQQLALDAGGMQLPTPLTIGRKINDLAAYPGTVVGHSALGSGLVSPGPWAQGSAAYAQLLRENPWYFAGRPVTSTELSSLITKGVALQNAARHGRSQALLVDHLLGSLQSTLGSIDSEVTEAISSETSNGYDPWSGVELGDQPLAQSAPVDPSISENCSLAGPWPTSNTAAAWNMFGATDLPETATRLFGPQNWFMSFEEDAQGRMVLDLTFLVNFQGSLKRHLVFDFTAHDGCDLIFFNGGLVPIRAFLEQPAEQQVVGSVIDTPQGDITLIADELTMSQGFPETVINALVAKQDAVWARLANAITNPDVATLEKKLTGYVDLLSAYLTFSAPELLDRSDIIRAAVRSVPGSDLSLRLPVPLQGLFASFAGNADGGVNIWEEVWSPDLHKKQMYARNELSAALLALPTWDHAYIAWNLADLRHLQANRARLAVDDTYLSEQGQTLIVDEVDGVIANDALQPFRPICVDVATAPMMTAAGGMISVMDDGSFVYSPPSSGFIGTDSFQYRLSSDTAFRMPPMIIPDCPQAPFVFSLPATVVIRVHAPDFCEGNANGDSVVDFNDLAAVLGNWLADYTPGTGEGDANGDGLVDFNDITAVLANWLTVCP